MEMHELFTKAAKQVDESPARTSPGACYAIKTAAREGEYEDYINRNRCLERLDAVYRDDAWRAGANGAWWAANFGAPEGCDPEDDSVEYDLEEAKQCRVLMLLFMAAMAEAGDL